MHQAETTSEALNKLARSAQQAQVFARVDVLDTDARVECHAIGVEATYRAQASTEGWQVSLITPDRWLSESIEADLMHSGDSLEELLEEELVDLGADTSVVLVQHFRSEDMLYTFRSTVPPASTSDDVLTWLMAYEATFRELGDMTAEADD